MAGELLSWLVAGALVSSSPTYTTIQVRRVADVQRAPLRIVVRDSATSTVLARIPVGADQGSIQAELSPSASTLVITCDGDDVWCPEIEFPSRTTEALSLPVFGKATLHTRVVVDAREQRPSVVDVQGVWLDAESSSRIGDVSFVATGRVEADGRVEVAMPKGLLDLRFSAREFVPVYRFRQNVAGVTSFSAIVLRRGSSVAGRVHDAATKSIVSHVSVTLTTSAPTAEQRSGLGVHWAVKSDENGFFQIAGVPPGRYWLTLARDSHSRGEFPCDVVDGAETFLPDLFLEPYGVLRVVVDPALDPSGAPWIIGIRRVTDRLRQDSQACGTATLQSGRTVFRRITSGAYDIEVRTSSGHVWSYDTHSVSWPDDEISIVVRSIVVRGTVRRGQDPVPDATVEVSTGNSDVFSFMTDAEGKFQGTMRSVDDDLYVAVQEDPTAARVNLTFSPPPLEGDEVVLDLRLGTIEAVLRVVDGQDSPVAGAGVHLLALKPSASGTQSMNARTNAEGVALMKLSEPGLYRVWAEASQGQSERLELQLAEGTHVERVLRLADGRQTHVSVLSASGFPVPGADLVFVASDGARLRARTDMQGRARLALPNGQPQFNVRVFAPTHVLWAGCVSAPEDKVEIRLPAGGGNIRLSPADAVSPDGRALYLITSDGGFLSRSDLAAWRGRIGMAQDSDRTPQIAFGTYSLVWWPGVSEGALVQSACAGSAQSLAQDSGRVTGFGELTLRAHLPKVK